MKSLKKFLTGLAASALLATGLFAGSAAAGAAAQFSSTVSAPMFSGSGSSSGFPPNYNGSYSQFCPGGAFGFNRFTDMASWLNRQYPYRAATQVWQARNDTDVWNTFCILTESKGAIFRFAGGAQTSPNPYIMRDGTRISLRLTSASGGYTIDINRPGVKKLYKVHVGR